MVPMDFSALNAFDYIVLTIVGLSTLFAFARGFIQTVMSFIAWIGSIFIAVYLFPYVQPVVAGHIHNPIVANTVTFLGTYFVLLIAFIILGLQLLYVVEALRFGPIDRALGFAFGALRGVVLVTVMFILLTMFLSLFGMNEQGGDQAGSQVSNQPNAPDWLAKAQTYDLLRKSASTAVQMVPDNLWDDVRGFAKNFESPKQFIAWSPPPKVSDIVTDMAEALPEKERKNIFRQYSLSISPSAVPSGSDSLDHELAELVDHLPVENFAFSQDVFRAYKKALDSGQIKGFKPSQETLSKLEQVFSLVQPSVQDLMKAQKSISGIDTESQAKAFGKKTKELDNIFEEFE